LKSRKKKPKKGNGRGAENVKNVLGENIQGLRKLALGNEPRDSVLRAIGRSVPFQARFGTTVLAGKKSQKVVLA